MNGIYALVQADGSLLGYASGNEDDARASAALMGVTALLVDAFPNVQTQYVANGVLTNKAAGVAAIDRTSVAADGVDFVTLSNLPQPCTVQVNAARYPVPDGVLQLTFNQPGAYTVTVSAAPFLDQGFQVAAQ